MNKTRAEETPSSGSRLFSPIVNTYAFVVLVGGALLSAWGYWRRSDRPGSRVLGNILIAIGAILPGIGGSFARAGRVEVLYVTELVDIILISFGYWAMTRPDRIDLRSPTKVQAQNPDP